MNAGIATFCFAVLCACRALAAPGEGPSLCDVRYPSDEGIEWECRRLRDGDSPYGVFGAYWQEGLRFNRIDRLHFHAGAWVKLPKRLEEIRDFSPMPETYPDAAGEAKFILVDQAEMFLGAYEYGSLVFSCPVSLGMEGHRVPDGNFRIDAMDPRHVSNLYKVEGTERPYPMHYGLRFFVGTAEDGWASYWIHGRDIPGIPASHGCIGLYDEEMQQEYYSKPDKPLLKDAARLYEWVLGDRRDPGGFRTIRNGPPVRVIGDPPF